MKKMLAHYLARMMLVAWLCLASGLLSQQILAESAQPLKAPGNLTAVLAGPRQVDLTWVDNSSNETGFRLERSVGSDFKEGLAAFNVNPNSGAGGRVALSDRTVLPDETYYYHVFALRRNETSAPSNVVQISTAAAPAPLILPAVGLNAVLPAAPTNLKVVAVSPTQIDLIWVDHASDETSYQVERSTDAAFGSVFHIILPADTTAFSDTGLSPSQTYFYRVSVANASGDSAFSNIVGAATAPETASVSPQNSLRSPSQPTPETISPLPPASPPGQNVAGSGFKLTNLQAMIIGAVVVVGVILALIKVLLGRRSKPRSSK